MKKLKIIKFLSIFTAFLVCLSINMTQIYTPLHAEGIDESTAISRLDKLKVEAQLGFEYSHEKYVFEPITSVADINNYDKYVIGYNLEDSPDSFFAISSDLKHEEDCFKGRVAILLKMYDGYVGDDTRVLSFKVNEPDQTNYGRYTFQIAFSNNSDSFDGDFLGTSLEECPVLYKDRNVRGCGEGTLLHSKELDKMNENISKLNPYFDISFDEDGFLVLSSCVPSFANQVLRLGKFNVGGPFFDLMSSTEMAECKILRKPRLYRKVNTYGLSGTNYRRINDESNVSINDEYILTRPNSVKVPAEEYDYYLKEKRDGYLSVDEYLKPIDIVNHDYLPLVDDQQIIKLISSDGAYKIYFENKGYLKGFDFGFRNQEILQITFAQTETEGDLFDLVFDNRGNLTIRTHDTGKYLIATSLQDSHKYESIDPLTCLLSAEELFIKERTFNLFKKINFDSLFKYRPFLGESVDDHFVEKNVVSVRLRLFVPAEVYNALKDNWKFYFRYTFDPNKLVQNDEQTVNQEIKNNHLDDQGNATFTVLFKEISLNDIDINITSLCYATHKNEELRTIYSGTLNQGNGYSIRDMVNKYLSMKDSQNPDEVAEYEESIKPHKEILEFIQNH